MDRLQISHPGYQSAWKTTTCACSAIRSRSSSRRNWCRTRRAGARSMGPSSRRGRRPAAPACCWSTCRKNTAAAAGASRTRPWCSTSSRATACISARRCTRTVAHYILALASDEQKRRWLPRMARGELLGAIAMTEPHAGSDLQAIKTTARRDGDHYVINGSKTFITNGAHAGLVVRRREDEYQSHRHARDFAHRARDRRPARLSRRAPAGEARHAGPGHGRAVLRRSARAGGQPARRRRKAAASRR